jgi:hypothetical protein
MTRLTACPSPKGTNIERLFIPLPANTLAHDAALDPDRARNAVDRRRGRARDEGEPDDELSEIVSELQGLFRGLSDADAVRADQLLEQLLGFCGEGEGEDEETGNNPENQQNLTSGTRDRRRGMAGDRRSRLPTAAQVFGGGMGLDARPTGGERVDAREARRAEQQFARMFPGAPPPRQA